MIGIVTGILLMAFTVFATLPCGLDWGNAIIDFLKGFGPVLAGFVGFIALLIGIADLRDKAESRKIEPFSASESEK